MARDSTISYYISHKSSTNNISDGMTAISSYDLIRSYEQQAHTDDGIYSISHLLISYYRDSYTV
jgi:hypothetical protein